MKAAILLVALTAACGDDGGVNKLDDAPLAPDGGTGAVTATVLIGGLPVANRTIFFQAPDGTEVATVQTDANGMASAMVPAGGSVTALDINDVRGRDVRDVVTIMGVKPGDNLTLHGDFELPQLEVEFTYPAWPGAANPSYGIATNCGGDGVGGGTTNSLGFDRCSPRIDTYVVANDGLQGPDVAYIAKLDQPIDAPVDLTGATWTTIPVVGSTYTNVPTTDSLQSGRVVQTPRGRFLTCFEADRRAYMSTYTAQMECPSIAGTTVLDTLALIDTSSVVYEITQVISAASPTLDLANTLIKAPTSVTAIDVATRTVSWSETTTGADPEFVVLRIGSADLDWRVIAPYTAASITLPPLLGDAAIYNLEAGDNPRADVETGSASGGYDAVRPHGPNFLDHVTTELPRVVRGSAYDG